MFLPRLRAAAASLLLLSCVAPSAIAAPTARQAPLGEEVRYPSEPGTVIAGTLEKPRVVRADPPPVVVIISGTGPWTRGGWVNVRARLHAAGIATLMYDKRGQGQSTGTFVDTIPAMERDVAAAVAFLRTRSDVNSRGIALMGISQGAVAAPLVASRDPAIAAVVMLSGPVGPRGELFLGILRGHLEGAGKNPEQIARVTEAVAAWMEARSRKAGDPEVQRLHKATADAFADVGFPREQALQFVGTLNNEVVLSMFEVAPDRALAALRAPVLAVYGSKDEVIAPALSIEAAATALSDNPDALVVAVPGMNHELQRVVRTTSTKPPSEDGTMPAVTEIVGDWLTKRLITSPASR